LLIGAFGAVSFTFAVGTAAGDLTASQLPARPSRLRTGRSIRRIRSASGAWRFRLNSVLPSGGRISLPDRSALPSRIGWVKPVKVGGLSYGDGPVAAVLFVIALILVTFVAARRSNVMSSGAKSPAWAPEIAEWSRHRSIAPFMTVWPVGPAWWSVCIALCGAVREAFGKTPWTCGQVAVLW